MVRARGIFLLLVMALATALLGQPAPAVTVMTCRNGVTCTSGDAVMRPCCRWSEQGKSSRGCVVRGSAGVDYFSQRYVMPVWGVAVLSWLDTATGVSTVETGRTWTDPPVCRPAWELLAEQGRGPRPPPVILAV